MEDTGLEDRDNRKLRKIKYPNIGRYEAEDEEKNIFIYEILCENEILETNYYFSCNEKGNILFEVQE